MQEQKEKLQVQMDDLICQLEKNLRLLQIGDESW